MSLPAISQPPTGIPQEINPNQINPQELTQPQLRSLLEDKNRETGKDRNAELNSKLTIEKDSVVKDDIKCVMEQVAPDGSIIDHIDGRTLNPGWRWR